MKETPARLEIRKNAAEPLVRELNLTAALPAAWRDILLVEDNSARARRRYVAGIAPTNGSSRIAVRVHHVSAAGCQVLAERAYRPGALKRHAGVGGKADVALELIDGVPLPRRDIVLAAGPAYGCNGRFLTGLSRRRLDYVVEVRPSSTFHLSNGVPASAARVQVATLLGNLRWRRVNLSAPIAAGPVEYWVARLADVELPDGSKGRLFAAQTGGILGVHRGTIFGLASVRDGDILDLLRVVCWARWIRPATRKEERKSLRATTRQLEPKQDSGPSVNGTRLSARANITIARRQDRLDAWQHRQLELNTPPLRGLLTSLSPILNVVELFAGAGGMGLGFLLAGERRHRYRVVFSGEVNPIFVETLKRNQDVFRAQRRGERIDRVPESVEPIDSRTSGALSLVRRQSREAGGVHILIGGPPCQGFSNANRNSWHSANPHNRLIEVFLRYVESLRPPVFLLENVQGILWTPKGGRSSESLSVVDHLARRVVRAGYTVFPKLLDAVWYGVPQYRSRFFLLGLRNDLGYRREDFGQWGPFPHPTHGPGSPRAYVTVRDAITDLPHIENGAEAAEQQYQDPLQDELRSNEFLKMMRTGARPGVILDHVTSRHAEYVIERYRHIPQGGNWQNIVQTLTNYADVERTHSNIYRRLKWDEPSITIGHYRKSMLVHPDQHRGLSLREASRLQSFPDWFRFSGGSNTIYGGLVHKQQQLANAVCPLVTMSLAEFILGL